MLFVFMSVCLWMHIHVFRCSAPPSLRFAALCACSTVDVSFSQHIAYACILASLFICIHSLKAVHPVYLPTQTLYPFENVTFLAHLKMGRRGEWKWRSAVRPLVCVSRTVWVRRWLNQMGMVILFSTDYCICISFFLNQLHNVCE